MKKQNLSEPVTFRVTPEQKALLKQQAQKQKLNVSEFIIQHCFDNKLKPEQRQALAASLLTIADMLNEIPVEFYSQNLREEIDHLWQSLT